MGPALADEPLRLVIRDHKFVPERLEVPTRVKFKLLVKNEGDVSAEFESFELDREKVVLAGEEIAVFLGPLDKGEYPIFDDFHPDTKGLVVAR
jgi:hypothetical protein